MSETKVQLSMLTQGGATVGQSIVWDGSKWVASTPAGGGGGAVLKVLSENQAQLSVSTTSTAYVDTGHSISFTPQSATSVIHVEFHVDLNLTSTSVNGGIFMSIYDAVNAVDGGDCTALFLDTAAADTLGGRVVIHGRFASVGTSERVFNLRWKVNSSGRTANLPDNGPTVKTFVKVEEVYES